MDATELSQVKTRNDIGLWNLSRTMTINHRKYDTTLLSRYFNWNHYYQLCKIDITHSTYHTTHIIAFDLWPTSWFAGVREHHTRMLPMISSQFFYSKIKETKEYEVGWTKIARNTKCFTLPSLVTGHVKRVALKFNKLSLTFASCSGRFKIKSKRDLAALIIKNSWINPKLKCPFKYKWALLVIWQVWQSWNAEKLSWCSWKACQTKEVGICSWSELHGEQEIMWLCLSEQMSDALGKILLLSRNILGIRGTEQVRDSMVSDGVCIISW